MKATVAAGTLGILVASLTMSGCLQSAETPFRPTYFHASFQNANGETVHLALDATDTIADRGLNQVEAYRLTIEGIAETVLFLDRSGAIVREDRPCLEVVDGECRYAFLDWQSEGAPAPFGVRLHPQMNDGSNWTIDGVTFEGTSQWTRDATRQVMTIKDFPDAGRIPFGSDRDGRYLYRPGEMVPTEIELTDDHWQRTALAIGDRLPAVHEAPGHTYATVARAGPLFPGESSEAEAGASYLHAWDALMTQSSEAATMIRQGGCWLQFDHTPPPDRPPIEEIIFGEYGGFTITLQVETIAKSWYLGRANDAGGTSWTVSEPYEASPGNVTCARLNTTPWPVSSVAEFLPAARQMDLPATGPPTLHVYAEAGALSPLDPTAMTYQATFRPAFTEGRQESTTGYRLYEVAFDPYRSVLDHLTTDPDHAAAFDG